MSGLVDRHNYFHIVLINTETYAVDQQNHKSLNKMCNKKTNKPGQRWHGHPLLHGNMVRCEQGCWGASSHVYKKQVDVNTIRYHSLVRRGSYSNSLAISFTSGILDITKIVPLKIIVITIIAMCMHQQGYNL